MMMTSVLCVCVWKSCLDCLRSRIRLTYDSGLCSWLLASAPTTLPFSLPSSSFQNIGPFLFTYNLTLLLHCHLPPHTIALLYIRMYKASYRTLAINLLRFPCWRRKDVVVVFFFISVGRIFGGGRLWWKGTTQRRGGLKNENEWLTLQQNAMSLSV